MQVPYHVVCSYNNNASFPLISSATTNLILSTTYILSLCMCSSLPLINFLKSLTPYLTMLLEIHLSLLRSSSWSNTWEMYLLLSTLYYFPSPPLLTYHSQEKGFLLWCRNQDGRRILNLFPPRIRCITWYFNILNLVPDCFTFSVLKSAYPSFWVLYAFPTEIWCTKISTLLQVLWDLNELHAVQNSSIYDEAIEHKEQAKKEFLALKPVCTLLFSIYARNMHIQSILPFPTISFLSFSYARLLTISHICLEKLNWGISCMLLHWVCSNISSLNSCLMLLNACKLSTSVTPCNIAIIWLPCTAEGCK